MDANLKSTLKKIREYTHEISLSRRLLTNSYNIEEIEQIEAKVKAKQAENARLKADNKKITDWLAKNEKAKQAIHENGFYDQEVYKLKDAYREDKQKIRELYYDTLEKRKQLIEKHDVVVSLENNIRRMKELVDIAKREKGADPRQFEETIKEAILPERELEIDEMQKKVDDAKQLMKVEQAEIEKKAKMQEDKISEMEYRNKVLQLKVREKDKELCLATLKIKELKRNLRYNALKPLTQTPGNLTSRKKVELSRQGLVHKSYKDSKFGGKRKSNDDFARISSNNDINDKNITGSEIRLEKSDSSVLSKP